MIFVGILEKLFRGWEYLDASLSVMHFWKMITIFYKIYLKKPIATFLLFKSALPMTKPMINLNEKDSKNRSAQSAEKAFISFNCMSDIWPLCSLHSREKLRLYGSIWRPWLFLNIKLRFRVNVQKKNIETIVHI